MNKSSKKILSLCMAVVLCIATAAGQGTMTTYAARDPANYRFNVSEGSVSIGPGSLGQVEVYYGGRVSAKTVPANQPITLTGSNTSNGRVLIGADCSLIFDDLHIANDTTTPFEIDQTNYYVVSISLSGTNTIHSGTGNGMQLRGSQYSSTGHRVTIGGNGSLDVSGAEHGIDIGLRTKLTITDQAKVTAVGKNGSGIGSDVTSSSSSLTVSGNAVVNAKGNNGGAGIGGGVSADGIMVMLYNNAKVTATGDPHGFGSGKNGTSGGTVIIDDNAQIWGTGNAEFRTSGGKTLSLLDLTVTDGNDPLVGATVLSDGNQTTTTDEGGKAYLYPERHTPQLLSVSKDGYAIKEWRATGLTIQPEEKGAQTLGFVMPATAVEVTAEMFESAVKGVSLNKSSVTLLVGEEETLIPTIHPTTALNGSATWSSSNQSVATVRSDGTVTAIAPGTADITVKTNEGDFTATCEFTVHPMPPRGSKPWISTDSLEIAVGDTAEFFVSLGAGRDVADSATIQSNNTSSVTVSPPSLGQSGMVTMRGVQLGQANISVGYSGGRWDGYNDSVHVTVKPQPVQVDFDTQGGTPQPPPITATEGESYPALPTVSRTGYTFDGWYTSASGGIRIEQGAPVIIRTDHTLYAQWSEDGTTEPPKPPVRPTPTPSGSSDRDSSGSGKTDSSRLAAQPRAITLEEVMAVYRKALPTAQNGVATAKLSGWFSEIDLSVQQALAKQAEKDGVTVKLQISQVQNFTTMARLTLNPAEATAKAQLMALATSTDAVNRTSFFKRWYSNELFVVTTGQPSSYGQPIEIVVKPDLNGMDSSNLVFYSYDKATNTYKRIERPAYGIDKIGYLHFNTELAGDIVISDGALVRK